MPLNVVSARKDTINVRKMIVVKIVHLIRTMPCCRDTVLGAAR